MSAMTRRTSVHGRKRGQGMTEYIIIVCLIAIACLLVVGIFGGNIRNLFNAANDSLNTGQANQATMQAGPGEDNVRINDFAD